MSRALGHASSVALKAYFGSDLERHVKDAIGQVPPEDLVAYEPNIVPKLVEIIIAHRLRMS